MQCDEVCLDAHILHTCSVPTGGGSLFSFAGGAGSSKAWFGGGGQDKGGADGGEGNEDGDGKDGGEGEEVFGVQETAPVVTLEEVPKVTGEEKEEVLFTGERGATQGRLEGGLVAVF